MNGHVSIVNSLLQEGIDANSKGGSYGTALQAAAYRGHSRVAELLLDASADVYLPGVTKDAFHAAAEGGHENVIRLFLDRGYTFRQPPQPPMYSMRFSRYKSLLRSSSPGNLSSDSSSRNSLIYKENYALEEAASNGHLRIVELILDNLAGDGARISAKEIGKSLYNASRNGHEEVVKYFLSRELDVAPYLKDALNAAAMKGHLGVVDTLTTHSQLSLPVDDHTVKEVAEYCTEVEKNILLPGCLGDHVPIITRALDLMEQRCSIAEVRRIHKIILNESSKYNSDKVIDLAFHIAQFDNAELLEAIILACEKGSIKTLRCLLSRYPCDSPRSISCGRRCSSNFSHLLVGRPQGERSLLETLDCGLYIAAFNGHTEVVKTLIQEAACVFEVTPQDPDEETPDNISSTKTKRDRIYRTALQAVFSGFTPQHEYAFRQISAEERAGREAIILLLLEHGANPDESNEDSDQLLSGAIAHCSDKTVQLMIDKGASLMNTHSGRMLAFKTAAGRELGAAGVMKVLLQAGGYLVERGPSKNPNPDTSDLNPVLDSALEYFDERDGQFRKSESVHDVLYTGPGAVVKMLLQLLPTQKVEDDRYRLLLQMAVSINDRVWMNFLFERGVNVNAQGCYYGTALQCVARFGNLELVQLLLSLGAEVNILEGEHGTALRAAVLGGHEKVVDVLLQHGADVNLCSSEQGDRFLGSEPILQLALKSPNLVILESLIAAGADLHAELSDQPPLLITACGLGDLAIVRLFLDNRFAVNPPRKLPWKDYPYWYRDEQASALHMACSEGHEDIARVLLEHGADVQLEVGVIDPKGYSSKTPLQMAAYAGHLSVVQLLINAGATIDHFNSHGTALSIASRKNRLEVVRELLLVRATIFDPLGRWNALAEACRSRGHAIVELLLDELPESLEERACANALSAAASIKDDGIFQMLLAQNIPVSPSTLSQACAASLHGSIMILLQRGVDIDGDDGERGRALQVASYHQMEATVDLLLDHGADVNTLTPRYGSPLQAALEGLTAPFLEVPPESFRFKTIDDQPVYDVLHYRRYNKPDAKDLAACEHIVRVLVARGANVNIGNPLHLAAYIGSVSIVQQLLGKGADLNSISDQFGTALFAALERGNEDVVKLLLRAGINVKHISSKHGTALHYACNRQNVRMVCLLLDHGADPDGICGSHGSPLTASISGQISWVDWQDRAKDVAEIILRRGNYMQIAHQDLLVAVKRIVRSNQCGKDPEKLSYGEEVVRLFLEHDQNLLATEPILVAAVENLAYSGTDTLRLLLQRDGGAGVKEAMVEAAKDVEIMKVLLKHRPICPVTPEVVCNFSKNYRSSNPFGLGSDECELIWLLLDHEKDMLITPTVMSTVLSTNVTPWSSQQTQNLIEYLFERNNELEVTESTVKEARTANVMKVLLEHAPHINGTPEMLSAASRSRNLAFSPFH